MSILGQIVKNSNSSNSNSPSFAEAVALRDKFNIAKAMRYVDADELVDALDATSVDVVHYQNGTITIKTTRVRAAEDGGSGGTTWLVRQRVDGTGRFEWVEASHWRMAAILLDAVKDAVANH